VHATVDYADGKRGIIRRCMTANLNEDHSHLIIYGRSIRYHFQLYCKTACFPAYETEPTVREALHLFISAVKNFITDTDNTITWPKTLPLTTCVQTNSLSRHFLINQTVLVSWSGIAVMSLRLLIMHELNRYNKPLIANTCSN
jgi:hypothetical protein